MLTDMLLVVLVLNRARILSLTLSSGERLKGEVHHLVIKLTFGWCLDTCMVCSISEFALKQSQFVSNEWRPWQRSTYRW